MHRGSRSRNHPSRVLVPVRLPTRSPVPPWTRLSITTRRQTSRQTGRVLSNLLASGYSAPTVLKLLELPVAPPAHECDLEVHERHVQLRLLPTRFDEQSEADTTQLVHATSQQMHLHLAFVAFNGQAM
jgi:hypothetical protein